MFEAMKPLREKGFYTLREQIHAMAEVPLAFEPGSRFLYGFASELGIGEIFLDHFGGKRVGADQVDGTVANDTVSLMNAAVCQHLH